MDALVVLTVLLFSVVAHEVAHARQALREGDDTAARLGRITLNPLPHLDPVGSVVLPLLLHLTGAGFIFGWAKPVPVNPALYRRRVAGDIKVSLAGIATNLGLAVAFTLLASVAAWTASNIGPLGGVTNALATVSVTGILLNLILALFNLIPVPPLDGSHVFAYLLPPPLRAAYRSVGRFGIFVVIGLLWIVPGASVVLLGPLQFFFDVALRFVGLWA